jgi:alpha-tubulin suppressor-like RCC1 family protein
MRNTLFASQSRPQFQRRAAGLSILLAACLAAAFSCAAVAADFQALPGPAPSAVSASLPRVSRLHRPLVRHIAAEGTILAWGNGDDGELGNGTPTESNVPVQAVGLTGVTAVSARNEYGLALLSDGTVWAWGLNYGGYLGPEEPLDESYAPVRWIGTGVTAISAGYGYGLVLENDGTVWGWGDNASGQLGNGATSSTPLLFSVQVTGLAGATAIAAGYGSSYALMSDGTVQAWGYNGDGELGNGTTTNSSVPVQVTGLSGVTAIAVATNNENSSFCLALRNDGTVWGWGINGAGELGNGTTTGSLVPVQVAGLTGITAIAAGTYTSLALKSDGTVWGWGDNSFGELGHAPGTDGDQSAQYGVRWNPTPVRVAGLTGVAAVATGDSGFSLALKNDGTVWAWGLNVYGELGHAPGTDGDVTDGTPNYLNPTPTQVTGLSGVTAISAGEEFGLAVGQMISGISGAVTPYGAVNQAQNVDFTFDNAGTDIAWTTTLNSDGSYVIPLATGTYNVGINGSKWLRTTLTGVTVNGILSSIDATILPGDLNGDNVVNLTDFDMFATSYGSGPTTANWNPNADLNCDGVVDINDFALLAQDYGLTGDPAP